MERLFKSIEDVFQMEASEEEGQLKRRLSCANVEYFLRINNVSDMSGYASEIWRQDRKERKNLEKQKEIQQRVWKKQRKLQERLEKRS